MSVDFWTPEQDVGREAPHAVVEWAAGSIDEGGYTDHEFAVDGRPYLRVAQSWPEELEVGEWYTMAFEVESRSVVESAASGYVERGDRTVGEFDVSLDPGERTVISTETLRHGERPPSGRVSYSLETTGSDVVHGETVHAVQVG